MMERVRRSLHSRPGVAVLIAVGILTPWSRCLAQATITVYAGTGNPGPIGDGGQARNAFLDGPESVALDSAGNLYIREHARVRKVTPAGVISTVAGNGTTGYSGDGGPGKDAKIGLGPQRAGLATDSAGNLYIADTNNYRVRKVDAAGIITTFAGNGQIGIGAPADGSQAKNVALCFPTGAAVDTQGNVYFGSSVCGGGVRKVDSAGIVTNVAKNAPGAPYGVALDTNGNLYLNQGGGPSVIRKVSTSGTVSVFAGNGTSGFSGDDGPATAAQLFEVDGVAVDSAGNVFIADSGNGRIRKVDTSGIITTVAGHGSVGPGAGCQNLFTTGCPATNLKFTPDDVAVDALGNLYTANFVSGLVYKISPNTSAPGCTYELSPGGLAFTAAGGNGTISVTAQQGCAWSVSGAPAWIINSTSGAGTATLTFQAAANSGSARTATVTIGGVSFAIEQAAASIPGAVLAGSLGQVTSQGGWDFTLDAINLGPSAATARFSFLNNAGGPLALPWTFPQTVGYPSTGSLLTDTLDRNLAPNAQLLLASTGPDTATNLVGSGQLSTNGNVIGFGIFSNHAYHWNAVVPLEARDSGRYILAFDNNDPLVTGVAVENLGAAANIAIIIRDDTGTQIGNPILSLPALGHASFMLNAQYPVTVNKRGTIEFVTPLSGRISVLGLRAFGIAALTTLPVLSDVGTTGGAIAHATYNGGFTSVFYLVNTGSTAADFTLSFFDDDGNPLSIPLSLPQSGSATTTSVLTRNLPAGAMLFAETVADDAQASVVGSALLTTAGNISGFEIFRWTTFNQEASVPLETRTPSSFVLVFDNTGGLTTGVALSNVASLATDIAARIYDDAGVLLQTVSIHLAGRGHTSFLLPAAYSATANRRGMVEFVVPSGGRISAIGLRAKSDGTLTTIPVLIK